jgi:cell division protein FtsW (lipid II flippase)
VLVLLVAALPMALILLQPDLGTVLVLVFIVLGVLAVSGASARWLGGSCLAGVVVSAGAVQLGLLDDYQLARFAAFADPELDPRGVGYNTNQARIAIGSGGLTGKGLFQGPQTSGRFIPEQQTDFVFTVAGEELGLLGASALLALLGVVLWRGLRIALLASDAFGRPRGRRRRLLVRLPELRQRRDDPRDHAGHRAAAALRLVRRARRCSPTCWPSGLLQNVHLRSREL